MEKEEANKLIDEYILSGKREEAVKVVMEYYSIPMSEASEKIDSYLPKLIKRQQKTTSNKGIFTGLGIIIFLLMGIIGSMFYGILYVCYKFIEALWH